MAKFEVDGALVRRLAKLLNETGLTELEITAGDQAIRVGRAAPAHGAPAHAAPPSAVLEGSEIHSPTLPPIDESHPGAINSPMVGTVYTRSDPESPPFVKIGDVVSEGQTVLLIEAMKTFNEIKAPMAGKVILILVENSTPVEFGEVLLILE